MSTLASRRLRQTQRVRPSQVLDESDMWDLLDQAVSMKSNMKALREKTRSVSEVTLKVSYPNDTDQPAYWNWQFLISKAFPDSEIALMRWTKPHPDWS
jgi:hypothetical protein